MEMEARRTTKLRQIMATRTAVTVPGAPMALFARVIEDLGFEAVYVTGAGIANTHLGAPDVGLTTLTELASVTGAIADCVALPVIVDADTGFGSALNVVRTIRVLERAGAAGVQIEDQIFPKRCGHFEGNQVIPVAEMVQKVKAAVDTRIDGDLQIIARTDARAIAGLQPAIDRAHAYIEAGADATFVEAPLTLEELVLIARDLPVPQIANVVIGGKTPDPGRKALAAMGFSIVLYANAALQAALKASYEALAALKATGTLASITERLASFEERQRAVAKEKWDRLESRYSGSASIQSTPIQPGNGD
jgi:2-methylisocitrate lyase-like PEP mutase family enzyme